MSYQSPLPPEQTQQQHATKRPWLPMRHVIGLALVLVFIVGSLGASWVGLGNVDWAEQGPAEEDPRGYKGDMMDDMSIAMLLDDREQFVKWGEGAVKEQLGQIWDESKKLGWKVGFVSGVRSEEDDKREELRRLEKDLSFHYPIPGLPFPFDSRQMSKRSASMGSRMPSAATLASAAECSHTRLNTTLKYWTTRTTGGSTGLRRSLLASPCRGTPKRECTRCGRRTSSSSDTRPRPPASTKLLAEASAGGGSSA